MANDIVPTGKRPRAIAKEKDGVVLYWIEEMGIAGLHQAALCRLFNCSEDIAKRILATISSGKDELILEAEIVTEKGLRVVRLLSESGFTKFARSICTSKAKESSKDTAWDLIEKFAAAGFKLMVLMELAPRELAARAVEHAASSDRLRELGLELQLRQAEQKLLDTRHIIVSTCPEPIQQKILGYQLVEKVEYRDRVIHDDDIIRDGTTINKTTLCHRYGLVKAGKPQYKQLTGLLDKLPSEAFRLTAAIVENKELELDFLPELDRIFQAETRQLNFGEN